jgi:hypothetical protein
MHGRLVSSPTRPPSSDWAPGARPQQDSSGPRTTVTISPSALKVSKPGSGPNSSFDTLQAHSPAAEYWPDHATTKRKATRALGGVDRDRTGEVVCECARPDVRSDFGFARRPLMLSEAHALRQPELR